MPDYVAILKRSISALPSNEPAMRQAVYDRARAALSRQLTSVTPPLSSVEIEVHHRGLEDAIGTVEAEFPAPSAPAFRDAHSVAEAEAEAEEAFVEPDGQQPDLVDEPPGHFQAFPPRPQAQPKPQTAAPSNGLRGRAASPAPARSEPATPVPQPKPRRSWGAIAAALVGLAVLAGLGGAIYTYRDTLPASMASLGTLFGARPTTGEPTPTPTRSTIEPSTPPIAKIEDRLTTLTPEPDPGADPAAPSFEAPAPAPPQAGTPAPAPAPAPEPLAPEAPAPGPDVAVVPAAPAPPAPAAPAGGPLVAQRAFYLEAGGSGAPSSSTSGQIAWTQVNRDNASPAIRGTLEIPERNVTATILITKNEDGNLPASHLIEISFSGTGALSTAPIERVPALLLKPSEQAKGQPLTGAAIPVTEKVYWIALSDEQGQAARNLGLLKDNEWFGMPILFKDGKQALLVFEKGVPGDKVFNDVITSWSAS